MDRNRIDAASGGVLVDKIPAAARALIANMAANSQQFNNILELPPMKVNEVGAASKIEQQLANLTSQVQQMATGTMHQAKVRGVCSMVGHATDICPTLQGQNMEQVNSLGGFKVNKIKI